ncbi:class I SAM-dependent methyltransferase [Microbulbifer guangxiensis]|uniref:class I SAM-dependent methyltransferase n=1 Tax=Microbulbifer guangxiensis TaxID=2904249 RepID=UPI001F22E36A|nr:class I SAM-dependent methyltransferase [Microbulbifer guangxiensis]
MSQTHWNKFWEQGFITTFGDAMRDNYQGPLRELWQDIFSRVKSHGRILDIATGSGALACIALQTSDQLVLDLEVLASDFAIIPENIKASDEIASLRKRITFFSHMPCENLGFPDRHFDLITSQFGIEYGDWKRSVPEVFRVLNDSGNADFFCHREQAKILKNSKSEIAVYRSALEEFKIFNAARNFAKALADQGKASQDDSRLLNQTINAFRSDHPGQQLASMMVADIASQLKKLRTLAPGEVFERLKERESEYSAALARLDDMVNAALSDDDVKAVINLATSTGFKAVTTQDFYHQGDLVGIHIHLEK